MSLSTESLRFLRRAILNTFRHDSRALTSARCLSTLGSRPSLLHTSSTKAYTLSSPQSLPQIQSHLSQKRHSSNLQPTPLKPEKYHALADEFIETLVSKLEEMQDLNESIDVEYSSGVLTLVFPPNGTYVLNKQPPNSQIWLSSPLTGPKRYDWVEATPGNGDWIYLRDKSRLVNLFKEEVGVDVVV